MNLQLLDQFEEETTAVSIHFAYGVLYAKYATICLVGFITLAGFLLFWPLDRLMAIVVVPLFASVMLLFTFALIGTFHCIKSYVLKEETSRTRLGVTLFHALILVGYFAIFSLFLWFISHLNPTGIS